MYQDKKLSRFKSSGTLFPSPTQNSFCVLSPSKETRIEKKNSISKIKQKKIFFPIPVTSSVTNTLVVGCRDFALSSLINFSTFLCSFLFFEIKKFFFTKFVKFETICCFYVSFWDI